MASAPDTLPASDDTRPLPGAWLVVGLLSVVGCLNYLDRIMINTMRESVKAAIPMGDDDYGALTMAFLVVYGVLSPVGGWCADRFSRSRVILISLAVWSSVTWATAYAQTYNQLLATRILMGVSEACYIPAALALIADYHRGTTRSLATGLHMIGIYAGMMLGGRGGKWAEDYGWSAPFMVCGIFGVAYAVVMMVLLRDAPGGRMGGSAATGQAHPLETLRLLAGNRRLWIITLHWSLLGFPGWALITWMPTFLQERFHLSQGDAGITANIYMQMAQLLAVFGGGVLADRWSRVNVRGRALVPAVALTFAAPFIYMTSQTHTLWIAVAGLIVFGLARGCSDSNMMPILCQVVEPRHRATGYGVLNFLACLIGGLAAYYGGELKEKNVPLSVLIVISAALVLISGLTLAMLKPERRD